VGFGVGARAPGGGVPGRGAAPGDDAGRGAALGDDAGRGSGVPTPGFAGNLPGGFARSGFGGAAMTSCTVTWAGGGGLGTTDIKSPSAGCSVVGAGGTWLIGMMKPHLRHFIRTERPDTFSSAI
jgi:hypothetical protein